MKDFLPTVAVHCRVVIDEGNHRFSLREMEATAVKRDDNNCFSLCDSGAKVVINVRNYSFSLFNGDRW